MTLRILSLTFNDLTSLNRAKPEINTSKSETDPNHHIQIVEVQWLSRKFEISEFSHGGISTKLTILIHLLNENHTDHFLCFEFEKNFSTLIDKLLPV